MVNAALLLGGCATTIFLLWQLQGAGRGVAVIGPVSARAQTAYRHIVAAQAALAQTDFAKSAEEFSEAQAQLQEARRQLQAALATSGAVLRFVDVTGTVRSGEALLQAGEALTVAGQHASLGIVPLLNIDLTTQEETTPPNSMVDALAVAFKEFSTASAKLAEAESALDQVNLDSLPPEIAPSVATLHTSIPKARQALDGFLDQNQVILSVLGADRTRQYLLLFENNHEIRPTGGFIGSVGLVNIDRGTVENIDIKTVYDPDGQLAEFIAPPNELLPITNRWFMRDANWFVDFSVSAQKVASFFEKEGGPTVDGVIALTPEVIKGLLAVTGPIDVPGYDVTVTPENFVVLTQDQVTYDYDKKVNRPKQFLGDLTPLILNRLFAEPAANSLKILSSLGRAIAHKQLLIYFRDAQIQERIVAAGWDGGFPENAQGFLNVNNANIGGHKSDQFIEQEIDARSHVEEDGTVETVLTIRRTHRGPEEKIDYDYPATENPAFKDNIVFQRVFVPRGAELLEARGFTAIADVPRHQEPEVIPQLTPDDDIVAWQQSQRQLPDGTTMGEEAGYPYFANWQMTKPGATSVGLYRYRVPQHARLPGVINPAQTYSMHVAKQPGDTRTDVRLELRLPEGYKIRHTTPSDGVTYLADTTVTYRGRLTSDLLFGAVYAKE